MKMDSTLPRAKLALNKSQIIYKRNFGRRLWCGNAKIKVDDYIWLEFEDRKKKNKLDGHRDGNVLVLDRTTRNFGIQQSYVVDRVNSYRVGWAPALHKTVTPRDALETTPEKIPAKNREGTSRLLKDVVDH